VANARGVMTRLQWNRRFRQVCVNLLSDTAKTQE